MKSKHLKYSIPSDAAGERADKTLARHMKETSRMRVQEAFAQGRVLLAGKPITKSHRVAAGDVLHVEMTEHPPSEVGAVKGELTVIFEDKDLLVVNKNAGIVMHPGGGTGEDTLAHFALHHAHGRLSRLGGARRPGIVHRLDKETSGAVVLAKSDRAYLALTKLFAEREVAKEYLALAQGVPELRSGSIREPIGRNPIMRVKMAVVPEGRGKPARTDWEVEEIFGTGACLVRCHPHTGRTHQIRVHLAHLGHPLLGDRAYGWKPRGGAALLAFPHPVSGKHLEFRVPPPEDFSTLAAKLREEAGRHAKAQVVK